MRAGDAGKPLAGYVSGPAAATEATNVALARAAGARTVVLVEGISDDSGAMVAAKGRLQPALCHNHPARSVGGTGVFS